MIDYKSVAKNYGIALAAQGVSTLASILAGFIVPKALGVTEFGYYQLFVFYSSYVGLCHLGLTDGVYLIMGGTKRSELDASAVKSQMFVGLVYEFAFSAILIGCASFGDFDQSRAMVFYVLAFYLIIKNIAAYLGFVLQAINETKLYSKSAIIERGSFMLLIAVLLIVHVESFAPYVIAYALGSTAQMIYCAVHSKEVLHAPLMQVKEAVLLARHSIWVGSKLLIANLAGMLIIGIARIAIDASWGIDVFGEVSFALSMITFFMAFITQASMVLFPALRSGGDDDVKKFYSAANLSIGLVFPIAYLFYGPLCAFVSFWLPDYSEAMRYLILLIPVCVFDGKMNITCATLYKVMRKEGKLLRINVATMACSFLMVAASVYILHSVTAVIASATIAIIARSLYSERDISRILQVNQKSISVWEIALTAVFLALSLSLDPILATVLYAPVYLLFVFIHRESLIRVKSALRK